MKKKIRKRFITILPVLLLALLMAGGCNLRAGKGNKAMAEQVREEFRFSWRAYMQYAKGYDMLLPLSRTGKNWYGHSLLMTPVDAFDTMILMGLDDEAEEAKQLILDSLRFDHEMTVQVFEVTIRLLGGLLSSYQLDGDPRFLDLATDLADRLMPAFRSPTGLPYWGVNLKTGAVNGKISNPAEAGTLMLEFGMVSKLTGDTSYYNAAKRSVMALFNRLPETGLPGSAINVETGVWTDSTSHIGGRIDSYLEYLLKAWLLFDDPDFKEMWDKSLNSVNRYLADTVNGHLWYGQADMITGKRTATLYGALEAFFAGTLALSGELEIAADLQQSNFLMWQKEGIEPEQLNYTTMEITSPAYHLRPENIESAWYLWQITGDPQWQKMGKTFFESIRQWCRTENGYVYLADVRNKAKGYSMESFFLAETLKYLYLLFSDRDVIDLQKIVLNTEAHPLKKIS